MTRSVTVMAAILILLCGLGAVAYPFVSNYLAGEKQAAVIVAAEKEMTETDTAEREAALAAAEEYNRALLSPVPGKAMTMDESTYRALLSAGEDGIMGVLEIPRIQVMLPIYHGTGDTSLQRGVGHIYGTSLPVGGAGTHTALSGHTGMAGQRMLSDLDQLVLGDTFCLRVWGESLTYEVDQIRVVLPEDVRELAIDPDKDYCTLVTCTPYGINTHRLLVRGIRTEAEYTAADAQPKPESPAPAASTWRRQIGRSILIGLAASAGLWLVVVGIRSWRRFNQRKSADAFNEPV